MVICICLFFFFKQKTAYEMRISDWSSDVCSSDLPRRRCQHRRTVRVGHRAPSLAMLAVHFPGARTMADIINLNKHRKQKARIEAERQAADNRVRFSRTKAEKDKAAAEADAEAEARRVGKERGRR